MSAITRTANRAVLKLSKHSPKILFGAGIAGMVGTVVVASRAAIKAQPVMQSAHDRLENVENTVWKNDENGQEAKKHQTVKVYQDTAVDLVKIYAPVVTLGAFSIVCLTKSHQILTNRNMALTAAYAGLDKAFREYRARVIDELGQDKDYEFAHKMTSKDVVEYDKDGNPQIKEQKKVSKDAQDIYGRMFDPANRYWEKNNGYNYTWLDSNMKYANLLLKRRGHLFLNEVYDMLGYDRTPEGSLVGWIYYGDKNSDGYVDFGIHRNSDFVAGFEPSTFLDFNVDGVIYDKI